VGIDGVIPRPPLGTVFSRTTAKLWGWGRAIRHLQDTTIHLPHCRQRPPIQASRMGGRLRRQDLGGSPSNRPIFLQFRTRDPIYRAIPTPALYLPRRLVGKKAGTRLVHLEAIAFQVKLCCSPVFPAIVLRRGHITDLGVLGRPEGHCGAVIKLL
jgi:hypothetical protein